ncbi:MAG TPA: IS4 family transposase [Polyangiaceae bacterium]|nr:IS4 family transposase [Polyangiaceae bacterium]
MKWAIVMAATASRIERLKHLARNEPTLEADREFTVWEIEAVRVLRRKYKRQNQPDPTAAPTISEIVLWLAELGGYTGRSSGGPPGSINIRRGLDIVTPVAAALEQLDGEQKMR